MKYVEVYTDSAEKVLMVAQAKADGLDVEISAGDGEWIKSTDMGVCELLKYRWPAEELEQKKPEKMICPDGTSCEHECSHRGEHDKTVECDTGCEEKKHQECITVSEYESRKKKKAVPPTELNSVPEYRPWKLGEMPSALWVKHKHGFSWSSPQQVRSSGFRFDGNYYTWQTALENLVWSDRPFGEARPCGIEVKAEVKHSRGVMVGGPKSYRVEEPCPGRGG